MCGIAGFVTLKPVEGGVSILQRMTDVIRHRGPNDSGYHSDGERVFLGHRRLSIIDLAGGHQPMSNEDGSDWIVYNGEVFNHASLRPALEQAGHTYTSHCDTETILHAYEEHGDRCVELFRGMFAFVIWDSRRQTLFCARDRLGIKPFYYYWDGTLFAFASEIKALLEHPGISARLDPAQLPEYLAFGYTSGEQTLFAGIRKLMPGHTLTLETRGERPALQFRAYWDVPVPEPGGGEKRSE
ncbi:MAG: asparagine synthetase B family protein, partial [Bryobacteraceae bacterium]